MLRRNAWVLHTSICLAASLAYFVVSGPVQTNICYELVGAVTAAAVVLGVRLHRPQSVSAWQFVALGVAVLTFGDVITGYYQVVEGTEAPFPGAADVAYVGGYLLLVGGLAALARRGDPDRRSGTGLEAAIVAVAAAVLVWQFLMLPYAQDPDLGWLEKAVSLAYPAIDLLLVALVTRLFLHRPWRRPSAVLLLASCVCGLTTDLVYAAQELSGTYVGGTLLDAGWLAQYTLLGAAALHPSMRDVGAPMRLASHREGRRRLALVATAGLVGPVLQVATELRGQDADVLVVSGGSIALLLLVLRRMSHLLGTVETAAAELEQQARHDPLTGLPNRAQFELHLERALERDGNGAVVVCYLDLDGFKGINDGAGHATGDAVLVAVAARLREAVRPGDLVARLGGDEFVVVLGNPSDRVDPARAGARMLELFREPVLLDGRPITVRASCGVAVAEDEALQLDPLMSRADVAMYTAKKRGRNQFVVYDEAMHRSVLGPLTMQARLEQAIAAREFEVYYQPIVRLADHRVVTLEALVRWRDEEGGLMSPADFLGVAESTGLVAQIDRLVLTAACRDLAAWRANGRWADRIGVAVNLSAASAQQPDLPDAVDDVVRHAGLRPKDLALEVSESVLIDETDRVAVGLQELRRRGVRVALDDFGTGYSSLQYLHRFPVDTLKIALPFVQSADRTETDQTVVRAMVGLGTALGLQVVAEGVETLAQAALLAAMGAQLGQGYLFARPVPADELVALLARSGGTLRPTESPTPMSLPR